MHILCGWFKIGIWLPPVIRNLEAGKKLGKLQLLIMFWHFGAIAMTLLFGFLDWLLQIVVWLYGLVTANSRLTSRAGCYSCWPESCIYVWSGHCPFVYLVFHFYNLDAFIFYCFIALAIVQYFTERVRVDILA